MRASNGDHGISGASFMITTRGGARYRISDEPDGLDVMMIENNKGSIVGGMRVQPYAANHVRLEPKK